MIIISYNAFYIYEDKTILAILTRNHSHVRLIISPGIIYICLVQRFSNFFSQSS